MLNDTQPEGAGRRQRVRRAAPAGMVFVAALVVAWSYDDLRKARAGPQPRPYAIKRVFEKNAQLLKSAGAEADDDVIDGLCASLLFPHQHVLGEKVDFARLKSLDGSALLAVALDRRRSLRCRFFAFGLVEVLCFGNARLSSEVRNASSALLQVCLDDTMFRPTCLQVLRVAWLSTPLRTALQDLEMNDAQMLSDLDRVPPCFENGIAWLSIPGVDPDTLPQKIEHNGSFWEPRLIKWET